MRICDLPESEIKVGMRVRSLVNHDKIGTIVSIDALRDNHAVIHWDGDDKPYSGFFGNDCECEIIDDVVVRLAKAVQNGAGLELATADVVQLAGYQEVQDIFYSKFDCFIAAPDRKTK